MFTTARILGALGALVLAGPGTALADAGNWRKPGLWDIAIWKDGQTIMRAIHVQQCSDVKSEPDVMLSLLPGQENCDKPEAIRSSKGMTIKTRCKVHDSDVDGEMAMTGDFSKLYRGRTRVSFTRGFTAAKQGESINFEARWLGACKPGMTPGDMVLSNGITVNVLRDKKRNEQAHQGG